METDRAKVIRVLGEKLIQMEQTRSQIELLRSEIFWKEREARAQAQEQYWRELRMQALAFLACSVLIGITIGVYLANH